jgi:hypothetical protein
LGVVQAVQALDVNALIVLLQPTMQLRHAQTPFLENFLETGISHNHGLILLPGILPCSACMVHLLRRS